MLLSTNQIMIDMQWNIVWYRSWSCFSSVSRKTTSFPKMWPLHYVVLSRLVQKIKTLYWYVRTTLQYTRTDMLKRKEVYGTNHTVRYVVVLSVCLPGSRGEWRRREWRERERWALKQDCPCFTWMSGSVIRVFPSVFAVVPYCCVWWYRIMKHIHDTPQWISLVINVQRPSRLVHTESTRLNFSNSAVWELFVARAAIYDINNINSAHWIYSRMNVHVSCEKH